MTLETAPRDQRATAQPLTIRGLTEIPYLETRLIAGAAGAERVVLWAHASEVERPWEWLEAGDLLMSIGLGLPAEPVDQAAYVENLARAGVSGMALAEGLIPDPLSAEMLAASERCALPILFTGWNVPFGQISRAVAAANYGQSQGRLVKTARIYDLVRTAVAAKSGPLDLFKRLEVELSCELYVCTNETGRPAFGNAGAPPSEVHELFVAALREHDQRLPGFLRVAMSAEETLVLVPIPTQRPATLLAIPRGDMPPFAMLQHVATAAALELERMWSAREERRRLGSETLGQLLEGRLVQGTAEGLTRLGVGDGPMVMLAVANEERPEVLGELHHPLGDHEISNLLLQTGERLLALLPDDGAVVGRVAALLPHGCRAGASEVFSDPTKCPTAAQQARWALAGTTVDSPIAHHGTSASLFGARSATEAQTVVDEILGPVIAYDAEHDTQLVHSLRVFLESNRSWKQATTELYVHKQTLIYRMRRIEELTGRKLSDTGAVAELWFALRAHDMVS